MPTIQLLTGNDVQYGPDRTRPFRKLNRLRIVTYERFDESLKRKHSEYTIETLIALELYRFEKWIAVDKYNYRRPHKLIKTS